MPYRILVSVAEKEREVVIMTALAVEVGGGGVKPVANLPPVSLTPVANLLPVSTTLAKTLEKFATGVVDTGGAP